MFRQTPRAQSRKQVKSDPYEVEVIVLSDSDDAKQGGSRAVNQKAGTPSARPSKRPRVSTPSDHATFLPSKTSRTGPNEDQSAEDSRTKALKLSQQDNSRLQHENENLRTELLKERHRLTRARHAQEEVATLTATLEKTKAEAANGLKRSYEALEEHKGKIEELRADLSRKEEALLNLETTKAKLDDAYADIARKQLVLDSLTDIQAQLTKVESQLEEKEKQLASSNAELNHQKEELLKTQSALTNADTEKAAAETLIRKLQEEISAKNVVIQLRTDSNIALSEDKNELSSKVKKLQVLQGGVDFLRALVKESEKSATDNQQKMKKLEEEISLAQLELSGRETELESANAKIAKLEEHADNCFVLQQPPEFWERARETCRRFEERYRKLEIERGWVKEG